MIFKKILIVFGAILSTVSLNASWKAALEVSKMVAQYGKPLANNLVATTSKLVQQAKNSHVMQRAEVVALRSKDSIVTNCTKAKDVVGSKTSQLLERMKAKSAHQVTETTQAVSHSQGAVPGMVNQAAKTDAVQDATASGFLNWAKTATTNTTTHHTVIHNNYAKKSCAEVAGELLKPAGSKGVAAAGFVAGVAVTKLSQAAQEIFKHDA